MGRRRAPEREREDVLARKLREYEAELIEEYLKKYKGSISRTARALGISRRALTTKIELHGIGYVASELREEHGIPGPRSHRK